MPAPTFDLSLQGAAPNQYATESNLEARINALSAAIWERMYEAGSLGWVVPLTTVSGVNAIIVTTPAPFGEVVHGTGTLYLLQAVGTNTGAVTLARDGGAAQPVLDGDGVPLAAGEIVTGRRYFLRQSGGSTPGYRIVSGAAVARSLFYGAGSLGWVAPTTTTSDDGSTIVTALAQPDLFGAMPAQAGTKYLILPLVANTGPVLLKIGAEDAAPLLDAAGLHLAAGELQANRHYLVRRRMTNNMPAYRLVSDITGKEWSAVKASVDALDDELVGVSDRVLALSVGQGEFGRGPVFAVTDADGAPMFGLDAEGRFFSPTLAEFAAPETEGIAFAFTSRDGRIMLGWDAAGNPIGGETADETKLAPYVSGAQLRAVGATDEVAAELGALSVLSAYPGAGNVRAVVNRPSIGATSVVAAKPGSNILVPCNPDVLHVFIVIGQSLAVGAESANSLVSTEPGFPEDVLMFDRGAGSDVRMGLATNGSVYPELDPDQLVGFRPLVARASAAGGRGQTIAESFGSTLARLARNIGVQFRMLYFTAGHGASPYDRLKRGENPYLNGLAAVERAVELAAARGWKVVVDGALHKHGEADASSSTYLADLIEWQAHLEEDLQEITGQVAPIPFFMHAPSTSQIANGAAMQAMLDAHNLSGNTHWLVGPDYPFGAHYSEDEYHFLGPGYFKIGEMMAYAVRSALWRGGGTYGCTRITGAVRTGTTVDLTYAVPQPPLAFDTTLVAERDVQGFRFLDDGEDITITSAAIVQDGVSTGGTGLIRLTLAAAPTGDERVMYAMSPQTNPRTAAGRVRGNVRDSSGGTSRYDNGPLYRWGVSQFIDL